MRLALFNQTIYSPAGLFNPDMTVISRKSFLVRKLVTVTSQLPKPCGLMALHRKWSHVSLCLLTLIAVQKGPWHLESSLAAKLGDAHCPRLRWLGLFSL